MTEDDTMTGSRTSENGGIITGFLLKGLITFLIFGAVLFETGAVIFAKVQADSIAVECAEKGAEEFGRSGSSTKAQEVAEAIAVRRGATLVTIEVTEEAVTVTIRVRAKTKVIQNIGPLKRHATATVTQRARVV